MTEELRLEDSGVAPPPSTVTEYQMDLDRDKARGAAASTWRASRSRERLVSWLSRRSEPYRWGGRKGGKMVLVPLGDVSLGMDHFDDNEDGDL
jgi:hypothetical protein